MAPFDREHIARRQPVELLDQSALPEHTLDLVNGVQMFWAGGCTSCHAKSAAKGGGRLKLGGGDGLNTPFGTFYPSNISPDRKDGIGACSDDDIVFLLSNGLKPNFEVIGGPMGEVQRNLTKLPPSDLIALTRYLKSVAPIAPPSN